MPLADQKWLLAAARGSFDGRYTIGFSADDARIREPGTAARGTDHDGDLCEGTTHLVKLYNTDGSIDHVTIIEKDGRFFGPHYELYDHLPTSEELLPYYGQQARVMPPHPTNPEAITAKK